MSVKTLFCIPVRAGNIGSMSQPGQSADIIEIWLDHLAAKDQKMLKENSGPWDEFGMGDTNGKGKGNANSKGTPNSNKKPLLFVNKGREEKGLWQGNEESRIELLIQAITAGADFVDVGIHTAPKLIRKLMSAAKAGTKNHPGRAKKNRQKHLPTIIISHHDFKRTPSQQTLWKIIRKAKKYGADIVKIVTTAQKIEDNFTVSKLYSKAKKTDIPLIAFCMGEKGKLSRILSPYLGSPICYVALDESSKTAPGQLTFAEMKELFIES